MLGHVIVIHETTNRVKGKFLGPKNFNSLVIQKPLGPENVVVKGAISTSDMSEVRLVLRSSNLSLQSLALEL